MQDARPEVYHPEMEAVQGISRTRGRILAIDFGLKRWGLAISDALGMTAQGLPTLECTRLEDALQRVRGILEEYSAERIIVGNPVGHGGKETQMSRRVAEFAEKLRRRLGCPVELWDERLISREANRMLRDSGLSIAKRRHAVDRVAATLLLESYLDYQAGQRARADSPEAVP